MKNIKWNDEVVDSSLYLLLQDLTTVLTGDATLKFAYSYGASIDLVEREVTGSSLWDDPRANIKKAGYKTDVLLRTLGTIKASNIPALKAYFTALKTTHLPNFATQLVTCLEDIRLEEMVRRKRPGTKRDFTIRKKAMKHFFFTQMKTNVIRSYAMDELFCLIYLRLTADEPNPDFSQANEQQQQQLIKLEPMLFDIFSAKDTQGIVSIAERIVLMLEADYTDMQHTYFSFPIKHLERFTENTLFDELTRTDPLANVDAEDVDQESNDYFEQPFSAWHRENENSDRKQNFLQFELDVGTKTSLLGGDARQTEDGDQAMASVQGTSGKSEKNDYPDNEALPKKEADQADSHGADSPYGQENKYAIAKVKEATTPSAGDVELYKEYVSDIELYRRKLANTIEKTLEHKRNAPRKQLMYGRLSKNLMPLFIEGNQRIFYKKTAESKEVDAVFTLLVDCSASMHNKMEETKRGIVLFHEVLNQLHIPHTIVGFWEDANEGTDTYHPNYLHYVHRFDDTKQKSAGAKIMQLKPEEDNRDGFSIRKVTEGLVKRREKKKMLLVFSDGEPAAMNYDQNGIVDTNIAVAEARKKGIDVIGMFLAGGEINEQEEAIMKNIYGKEHLMIPDVGDLTDYFAPLLKKLLLRGL